MEPERKQDVGGEAAHVMEEVGLDMEPKDLGPNKEGSGEDVSPWSNLEQGPGRQRGADVTLAPCGSEDNLSEAGSLSSVMPDWYKDQQEKVEGKMDSLGTKVDTKMERVEALMAGQFQQLMSVLRGQSAEQAALKSQVLAQEARISENQRGLQCFREELAVVRQECEPIGQLVQSTNDRLEGLERRIEHSLLDKLAKRLEQQIPGGIAAVSQSVQDMKDTKGGPGGASLSLCEEVQEASSSSGAGRHAEPAPLLDPDCGAETPVYVTKERGVRAPDGFTSDQQGFTDLGRLMQGRKGMVAARMPVLHEVEPSNQSVDSQPSIVKQLSYTESAPGPGEEPSGLSGRTTYTGGARVPTPTPQLPQPQLDPNAPTWGTGAPGAGPWMATGGVPGQPGAQAMYTSPCQPYPPMAYPYPMWSPVPPAQPQKRNRNPGVTLMKYSGKESLQDFLLQIENAARIGDWDQTHKGGRLYGQLIGSALRVANALPDRQRNDFEVLKRSLQDRFEGDLERDRCREALRACKRRRNESLMELSHRIMELARKAYPPGQRDEEGVVAFRNALPEDLGRTLVTDRPNTVDEAVDRIASLEVYLESSRQERRHAVRAVQEVASIKEEDQARRGTKPQGAGNGGATPSHGSQLPRAPDKAASSPLLTPKQIEALGQQILQQLQPQLLPYPERRPGYSEGRHYTPTGGRPAGPNPDVRKNRNVLSYGMGSQNGGMTGNSSRACFACGQQGHWRNECPFRGRSPSDTRVNSSGNGKELSARPSAQLSR